jgi:sensor histidine kinase regulating citrate/malate metabolism
MDVRVREELSVTAADLSVIIGNTFDNAIEAVAALADEGRHITVQLILKDSILFYEITNPLVSLAVPKKNEKTVQGYGLKNVRRCIEKYRGNLSVTADDGEFKVTAMIAVA